MCVLMSLIILQILLKNQLEWAFISEELCLRRFVFAARFFRLKKPAQTFEKRMSSGDICCIYNLKPAHMRRPTTGMRAAPSQLQPCGTVVFRVLVPAATPPTYPARVALLSVRKCQQNDRRRA